MGMVKFAILGAVGLVLAGCQEEAGFTSQFPPLGGQNALVNMPEVGPPADLTPAPTDEAMGESLSSAVDAALQDTAPTPEAAPDDMAGGGVANVATGGAAVSTGEGIASDSGVLNLAEQSQAEQLRLRELDAAALEAAAANRVIIQPGQMPEVIANVNVITYARETTNAVGERLYRRPSIRRTNSGLQCRKFDSADNAQRNFLANGGPQDDPLNLDPDGDGFACRWSPEAYRALVLD